MLRPIIAQQESVVHASHSSSCTSIAAPYFALPKYVLPSFLRASADCLSRSLGSGLFCASDGFCRNSEGVSCGSRCGACEVSRPWCILKQWGQPIGPMRRVELYKFDRNWATRATAGTWPSTPTGRKFGLQRASSVTSLQALRPEPPE